MREILFRGKDVDGKWVEGYYIVDEMDESKAYIGYVFGSDGRKPHDTDIVMVDKSTTCQCTGLTDKNGRKIFEGDIVSAPFTGYAGKTRERKGIVEFVKGAFSVNWKDSEEYGKNFAGYVNDIEVIGNIFDNPELIGDQP